MMTKRIGGTAAKNGFYWNLGKWEMATVPRQGGIQLPAQGIERVQDQTARRRPAGRQRGCPDSCVFRR